MDHTSYDQWLTAGRPATDPPPVQDGPCRFTADGQHDWAPDPDNPDLGDCCTLCAVGR
jgi:hypothetical protein